jgi:predicted DCC family thiol-disulfide oxidoreductase YuxK
MNAQVRPRFSFRADHAVPDFPDGAPLVVYDGVCGLCSGWVKFILRRDGTRVPHLFASAQSALGSALYRHYGYDPSDPETLLVVKDGVVYIKRDAVAVVLAALGVPWSSVALLIRAVPSGLAERAYDLVARHRYKIWGRNSTCLQPPPGIHSRFLQ